MQSHIVLFLVTCNSVDYNKYCGNMYLALPVMLIRHFFIGLCVNVL